MTEGEEAWRQIPYRCILSSEVIAVSGKTHLSHTPRDVTTVGIIFFSGDVKQKRGSGSA